MAELGPVRAFAVVREPLDRFLSAYYTIRSRLLEHGHLLPRRLAAPRRGGAGRVGAEAKQGLTVSYSSMQDGRDKVTDASTGFKVRSVNLDVKFCDDVVLVATLPDGGELVFESEPEMQKELGVLLRKDLTKEGEQLSGTAGAVVDPLGTLAQIATGAKKPWDLFK